MMPKKVPGMSMYLITKLLIIMTPLKKMIIEDLPSEIMTILYLPLNLIMMLILKIICSKVPKTHLMPLLKKL